jgi:hypothetical protein
VSDAQEINTDDILEETPSISPMAMSVPLPIDAPEGSGDDEDVGAMLLAHRKLRLRKIVKTALAASVAIILVASIRTGVEAATTPARAAAAEAPRVTQPVAPPPPAPVAVAAVVAPAPAAPLPPAVGTITAPRGQAFTVDGIARAAGASVTVPCGSHVVRIGRDAPQTLDVLCGKTVMAGAKAKTSK